MKGVVVEGGTGGGSVALARVVAAVRAVALAGEDDARLICGSAMLVARRQHVCRAASIVCECECVIVHVPPYGYPRQQQTAGMRVRQLVVAD